MLNGIEAQMAVIKAGGETWRKVKEWGMSRSLLTPKDAEILDVAQACPRGFPPTSRVST